MRKAFALGLLLLPVLACAYPDKPVRLVVPFAPGGAADIIGRLVAGRMQTMWERPVVVENRPGAGTVVGTDFVAKSSADGHTLGLVVTAHVINPSLRRGLPYDTLRDLAAVSHVSVQHLVIATHPSVDAADVSELIALAKRKPGGMSYATPGSGTAMHLAAELLKARAGIDIQHVPYNGGALAQQDVAGGRVPILLEVLYAAQPLIDAGKLKPIALLSPRRVPGLPLPVVADTVPGVSALSIVGIVAPSGTPRPLVRKISADLAAAVTSPDLAGRMAQLGMQPVGSTPEEFEALIRAEIEKWAKVVAATGAKAD